MEVDLETAVRTLVVVAMAQDPGKRVTASLIVAMLSQKFANVPEEDIARLVATTILEEGGIIDRPTCNADPGDFQKPGGVIPAFAVRLQ